jgi:Zn-dependent protease
MKKRLLYIIAFIILTAVEVLIAMYVHDSFIRPYIGDVLVMGVLYCFIRSFMPEGVSLLPLWLFLVGVAAELLQYFNLVSRLGLDGNDLMRVILGSTFDFKDIACYGAGCLLIAIFEKCIKGGNRR